MTAHQEIEHSLLETVSRLTGYPMEMLALDMDIEADLGIDSIKRVEILSTLEEKIPDLPPVSPELMGTLKTLAQIVEYLSGTPRPKTRPIKKQLPQLRRVHVDTVEESLDRLPKDDAGFSPEYLAANIGRKVVSIVDSPWLKTTG